MQNFYSLGNLDFEWGGTPTSLQYEKTLQNKTYYTVQTLLQRIIQEFMSNTSPRPILQADGSDVAGLPLLWYSPTLCNNFEISTTRFGSSVYQMELSLSFHSNVTLQTIHTATFQDASCGAACRVSDDKYTAPSAPFTAAFVISNSSLSSGS